MKNTSNLKTLVWLMKSRTNAHGTPILIRITVNGTRAEIGLNLRVNSENFDPTSQRVSDSERDFEAMNKVIRKHLFIIREKAEELEFLEEEITAQGIKERLLGLTSASSKAKEKTKQTLQLRAAFHKARELQVNRGDLARSTFKSEEYALNKLETFIHQELGKKDIPLMKLNLELAEEYEYFLKSRYNLEDNSAMKTMKIAKRMLNWGVSRKWIDKNPWEDFKLKFKWKVRDVLLQNEIDAIANKTFMIKRIDVVRDLFLFACYTGLAYADVVALKNESIIKGIDGNEWIKATRKKSNTIFNTPVLPPARAILDKYAKDPEVISSGFALPRLSNQKVNSYLKEIQDMCGIHKNLTFHLARHTFATTVALANGVPLESVAKMLGHKKLSTTQVYAQVLEQKLSQDTEVLRGKFSQGNSLKKAAT